MRETSDADGADVARLWLLGRIDRRGTETVKALVDHMAEQLAVATGEAVTVRVLSADGEWLRPVSVHHPSAVIQTAMRQVMHESAQRTDSGLWQRVLHERRAARWHIPDGYLPPEASAAQIKFLRRFPIRAVLGAPLIAAGRLLGGVSLVRYTVDRAFSEQDEALLTAVAARLAPVLDCLRTLENLREVAGLNGQQSDP